jgi:hypothetical protein
MWAGIAAIFQLLLLFFSQWFKAKDEKKEEIKKILKEDVPNAKDASSIIRMFDRINRV